MASISMKKAQSQIADLIKRVHEDKERIIITNKRKKVAALIPIEDVEWLEEIEDREDVEDAKKALAEPGESISLEELEAELGLRKKKMK